MLPNMTSVSLILVTPTYILNNGLEILSWKLPACVSVSWGPFSGGPRSVPVLTEALWGTRRVYGLHEEGVCLWEVSVSHS